MKDKKRKHPYDGINPLDEFPHPFAEIAKKPKTDQAASSAVETFVMPPLSLKAKRKMPIEMVTREEYEEIKTFYKDVYHLLGSMNYNPDAKNVNGLLKRAKQFVEKHQY